MKHLESCLLFGASRLEWTGFCCCFDLLRVTICPHVLLAFPRSRTPTKEVTSEPEGEKDLTKTYDVQLFNIPRLSKKFQQSHVIKVKYEQ